MSMSKQKTKTPAIKVGDRVRIVTPAFFIRCGYPLDFATEVRRLLAERGAEIREFVQAMGVKLGGYHDPQIRQAMDGVAKAIAHPLLKQAGFGGKTRSIHTHDFPDLAGVETMIAELRFVKTGEWTPGHDRHGEYEPPYLACEKTHRILRTYLTGLLPGDEWPTHLEIDAENVELVAAGGES